MIDLEGKVVTIGVIADSLLAHNENEEYLYPDGVGETIYYRMKAETTGATLIADFRYYYL